MYMIVCHCIWRICAEIDWRQCRRQNSRKKINRFPPPPP